MNLPEFAATGLRAWLLPRVQALPGLSTNSFVLDLGCGPGAWLARLHAVGFRRLTGIDCTREYFAADDYATFIHGDIEHSARAELGNFDLITAIEVFEHMAKPESVFAFASRQLGPGGYLIVTTPNIYSLRVRMRFLLSEKLTWFEQVSNPEHVHPLVIEAVKRQILPKYDLALEKLLTYPEHGSDGTRWFARLAERALSMALPNDLPGDSLCLFLRKR